MRIRYLGGNRENPQNDVDDVILVPFFHSIAVRPHR
jgi:hypothetical protein